MAILDHIQAPFKVRHIRCYLAARNTDNSHDDWVDISRYIEATNIGQYKRSIDSDDFDIGFNEESNITIGLHNVNGEFTDERGFFENKLIDRSKIRLIAGFFDTTNNAPDYEVDFEGIIDDRATSLDDDRETVRFTVLSYSSVINSLRTAPGAVTNGQDFKTALYNLLNRSEINTLLTVSLDNINPQVNQVVNVANWFAGKALKDSINKLLLASNSVLKVNSENAIVITGRQESTSVRFQFFGKGSQRPVNLEKITGYHSGLRRVITSVTLNNVAYDADGELVRKYGLRSKALDFGFLDDTDAEAAIAEDVLDEFAVPKAEMEITTGYLGNEVDLLDLVTIDHQGRILDDRPALYGLATYGTSTYVRRQGGLKISNLMGFKVLSITHNYRSYTTVLKVRTIGNREFDNTAGSGLPVYGQAIYGASVYQEGESAAPSLDFSDPDNSMYLAM